MKMQIDFLKTTIIGGAVFLVPIVILAFILGKAFAIMRKVAEPVSGFVPIDFVGGVAMVNLIAVAIIVLLCFLAGLTARSVTAGKIVDRLESVFLARIPMYAFIKGIATSVAKVEKSDDLKPALVQFDDCAQIGFEVERLDDGSAAIYLPGAPNPWSGSICIVAADRITPIHTSMLKVIESFQFLGKGSQKLISTQVAQDRSRTTDAAGSSIS